MEKKPRCQVCGREVVVLGAIGRRDTCEECGADLHACRQCEFYDVYAADQCREPSADKVADKEAGNFCDFFRLSRGTPTGRPAEDPAAEARRKLEELFKKK
jgi:hypothetical protein